MGVWKQIGEYLYLRKKDPNAPDSNFLRKMHGINRLSIFLFLIAIIIMIIKLIRRS
jgi:hypothetical protein